VIGIYGVMSYSVERRTREIGIRMALGAGRREVLRMVARQAMLLAGAGIAIGTCAALVLTRFLRTLLFEVSPADPAVFAAVASLLLVAALAGSCVPARRATRVDPLTALHYE
jgi:putative ABC transport system permease protein